MSESQEIMRAYRVCLDPSEAQAALLAQYAGAARTLFNWALAEKMLAWNRQKQEAAWLTYTTLAHLPPDQAEVEARRRVRLIPELKDPSFSALSARFTKERGDESRGIDGIFPWWRGINRHVFVHAMRCADAAFRNFFASLSGQRSGPRMGYPRFKKKGRCRDSFTIFHDVKSPTIKAEDARHLRIPTFGVVRTHGGSNLRKLVKRVRNGRVRVRSVTVSRHGHRWFAAIRVIELMTIHSRPNRTQRDNGTIGVDVGVKTLAALSDGTQVANPHHLRKADHRLTRAQQALSRTQRGSNRRRKAANRVGRIHAQVAEQRAQYLHQITKRLATSYAQIGVEDLNVKGMTASARGTLENPGKKVRQQAGRSRSILDASFGEIRRQLGYKTDWYGSDLTVIDRWIPTSKTCSRCGNIKSDLTLKDRVYRCSNCGLVLDRDINAAKNIAAAARAKATPSPSGGDSMTPDASDKGVPEANIGVARGERVRPISGRPVKEAGRPRADSRGSPSGSNPRAPQQTVD